MKTSGTIFFFLQRHSYAIVKLPESSLVLSMKINIDDITSQNSGQRKEMELAITKISITTDMRQTRALKLNFHCIEQN